MSRFIYEKYDVLSQCSCEKRGFEVWISGGGEIEVGGKGLQFWILLELMAGFVCELEGNDGDEARGGGFC